MNPSPYLSPSDESFPCPTGDCGVCALCQRQRRARRRAERAAAREGEFVNEGEEQRL